MASNRRGNSLSSESLLIRKECKRCSCGNAWKRRLKASALPSVSCASAPLCTERRTWRNTFLDAWSLDMRMYSAEDGMGQIIMRRGQFRIFPEGRLYAFFYIKNTTKSKTAKLLETALARLLQT